MREKSLASPLQLLLWVDKSKPAGASEKKIHQVPERNNEEELMERSLGCSTTLRGGMAVRGNPDWRAGKTSWNLHETMRTCRKLRLLSHFWK